MKARFLPLIFAFWLCASTASPAEAANVRAKVAEGFRAVAPALLSEIRSPAQLNALVSTLNTSARTRSTRDEPQVGNPPVDNGNLECITPSHPANFCDLMKRHPFFLGSPWPYMTAYAGGYFRTGGTQYNTLCGLEAGADDLDQEPSPPDSVSRIDFYSSIRCNRQVQMQVATELRNWSPTGGHGALFASGGQYGSCAYNTLVVSDSCTGKGLYYRNGTNQFVRGVFTAVMPNGGVWSSVPGGCTGVNTPTMSCPAFDSLPFQYVFYPPRTPGSHELGVGADVECGVPPLGLAAPVPGGEAVANANDTAGAAFPEIETPQADVPTATETPSYSDPHDMCPDSPSPSVRFHESFDCTFSNRAFAPSVSGGRITYVSEPFCDYLGPSVKATIQTCLQRFQIRFNAPDEWQTVSGSCRTRTFRGSAGPRTLRVAGTMQCKSIAGVRDYRTRMQFVVDSGSFSKLKLGKRFSPAVYDEQCVV